MSETQIIVICVKINIGVGYTKLLPLIQCHSEERSDEESDNAFFEILRYAQNDGAFILS